MAENTKAAGFPLARAGAIISKRGWLPQVAVAAAVLVIVAGVLANRYFDDRYGAAGTAQSYLSALAKGDEVWSYNTEVQDPYSPKWEIDFAPINFRIQPGFINQSLHLTGLLYWSVRALRCRVRGRPRPPKTSCATFSISFGAFSRSCSASRMACRFMVESTGKVLNRR